MKTLIYILLLLSCTIQSQQLAFPEAIGAGAYTTGGRGGIVVKVTNLNDSGAGSLRAALLLTVPRIIVFDVSGRIHLTTILEIGIANSNFTVAGQTAPRGGITISGKPVKMGGGYYISGQPCNNGIWRYIRFRNGSYTGESDVYLHNGFMSNGTVGLILDHCSFSFNDDQAISLRANYDDLRNITIQRCLFSENATGVIIGLNDAHTSGDATFIYNLTADQNYRTPNIGGTLQFDVINNVYFNFGHRLLTVNYQQPKVNFIGNYIKKGSYSTSITPNRVQSITPSIYTAYNYHSTLSTTPQFNDTWLWSDFYTYNALPTSYFTTTQFPLLGAIPTIKTANTTFNEVLSDVGANTYLNADGTYSTYVDSFDTTKINNVLNNISSNPDNKSWTQPTLPNNQRPVDYDTDDDGMADYWELSKHGTLMFNGRTDIDGNGYTELEDFINGIDETLGVDMPTATEDDTKWCVIYDVFGRSIYTGLFKDFTPKKYVTYIVIFENSFKRLIYK